ncbi:MAG: HEPN domain-containing protein [Beijerinckiaceae bacterium]|nr:HEPN domain-containing protein [Beijerinckiaceae bacterium]MCI0736936.1 HEPN domain-containing protein [Beijerinckiaceae bacterium]
MKAESAAFLRKSHEFLVKAQDLLDAHHWPDEAGRAAYLAGYHAAQAFLFESTGKVFKTHRGVRKEFLRLTKDDPRFDTELRAFLGRAYNIKAIADYETGPGLPVSPELAREAIESARRFVDCVTTLFLANGRAPHGPEAEPKP